MCVYIYIYIYIYKYILYVYVYVHVYVYVYIYIYIYVYIYMYIYAHTHTHTYMHTRTHTRTHTSTHTHTHSHTHTLSFSLSLTHTRTHTHTHHSKGTLTGDRASLTTRSYMTNDPCPQQSVMSCLRCHISCTNEACHIRMRHVPYEWGMSHMNEACPIWMRHVKCSFLSSWNNLSMSMCNDINAKHVYVERRVNVENVYVESLIYAKLSVEMEWLAWVELNMFVEGRQNLCGMSRWNDLSRCSFMSMWNVSISRWNVHVGLDMTFLCRICPIWMRHVPYEWVMSHIAFRLGGMTSTSMWNV